MNDRQAGAMSGLAITSIALGVVLLAVSGFAAWAFTQYLDYKGDIDPRIAVAVAAAKEEQSQADLAEFAEKEKSPTRQLVGPDDLGRVTLAYPKTWSVYVDKTGDSGTYEAYLYPGSVPGLQSHTPYALRVTVEDESYQKTLDGFKTDIREGRLKSRSIKIGDARGVRLDGELENDIIGSMVIFKVRDKSLMIFTESINFRSDFNKYVLPSLKFNR